MSKINKYVLDNIFSFKSLLDTQVNMLIQGSNGQLNNSKEFYLHYIIGNNALMNLNYLLIHNPDYEYLGFPGVYRNIRNSIEAYYDLYNLRREPGSYEYVMKNSCNQKLTNDEEILLKDNYGKFKKKSNANYYTIKDKENIALLKFDLSEGRVKIFTNIINESNSYVHPNIFVTPKKDKEEVIGELLIADVCLLKFAYDELLAYYKNHWVLPYGTYDSESHLNEVLSCIANNQIIMPDWVNV